VLWILHNQTKDLLALSPLQWFESKLKKTLYTGIFVGWVKSIITFRTISYEDSRVHRTYTRITLKTAGDIMLF
jgi:hypothetical protein